MNIILWVNNSNMTENLKNSQSEEWRSLSKYILNVPKMYNNTVLIPLYLRPVIVKLLTEWKTTISQNNTRFDFYQHDKSEISKLFGSVINWCTFYVVCVTLTVLMYATYLRQWGSFEENHPTLMTQGLLCLPIHSPWQIIR